MKLKSGTKLLIYITACSLHKKKIHFKSFNKKHHEALLKLSHRHNTGAITAFALLNADFKNTSLNEAQQKKWESIQAAAIKRRVLFDLERQKLLEILEKKGIWYCPLKGIILQDLYPIYEMREMSDNDILFDESKRPDLKKIMLSLSYTLEDHGISNHDMYTKEPVYNFEFHTKLFMHTFSTKFTGYYDNIKKKLIKDEKKSYAYHLNDEDFYIYMMAHAYKHFNEGGTGIRSLTDTYIYNIKKEETLDRAYIKSECKKLGINTFEQIMRKLSFKLFEDPDKTLESISKLNNNERKLLSYISFTGSYSTKEDFIKSRIRRSGSKAEYIFSRLFPDKNYYREAHPFLYKHKLLIPLFLQYRFIKMLCTNLDEIKKEVNVIKRK